MNIFPRRGEIWWISLDPTIGREIKKKRPCLVLSKDEYNRAAGTITIIPITSGKARYPAWEVDLPESVGLSTDSHVVVPQIRVAAQQRLDKKPIGKITIAHMHEIEEKLLFYLGIDGSSYGFGSMAIVGTTGGTGAVWSSTSRFL